MYSNSYPQACTVYDYTGTSTIQSYTYWYQCEYCVQSSTAIPVQSCTELYSYTGTELYSYTGTVQNSTAILVLVRVLDTYSCTGTHTGVFAQASGIPPLACSKQTKAGNNSAAD